MSELTLNEDRLFPAEETMRSIAGRIYKEIADLPIISPHGHTDPVWFANNDPFSDPADLLIVPDHYVFRMLFSHGVSMESLGIKKPRGAAGEPSETDPRKIWQRFAEHYYLFAGTPTRMWHDWVYHEVFGLRETLSSETADLYYETIAEKLAQENFRPRALLEAFGIEVIATTEDPLDPLKHHAKLHKEGWGKRVITAFRPDNVTDPQSDNFQENLDRLGEITGCDTASWTGYLDALRNRRSYFQNMGATSTDHGHPTAFTADLDAADAEALFLTIRAGNADPEQEELFRGQMLTEMARMSLEDGLVMQIHPGCHRNHNIDIFRRFGHANGGDIPVQSEYTRALHPLLNRFGSDTNFRLIVFTLDETNYARELAPLAGHYPALKLGPAWWFHDSPEGMRRFREQTTETAGFYNTVGFNDDTRALLSIPARHDVSRRMDSSFLARLVAEHRLKEDEAIVIAKDLTYTLPKSAYNL